jgi:hypothetical protein
MLSFPLSSLVIAHPKRTLSTRGNQEGGPRYTAEITALISDSTGATTTWRGTLTIQDPYLDKSEEDIAAALAQVVEGKVVESLQKGDSSVALSTVSNVARAAGKADADARRQRPEQTLLGRSLLEHLKAAANVMVIRPENVVEVIQTLSAVTQLKEAFNTTHIQQIFDLELQFALRVSGSSITTHTAELFVKALGDLLEPSFLNDIIENDFGTASPQAGGGGRYSLTKNFTSALSSKFENIKVEVGNAVLARSVDGEPPILLSSDGVAMSAQRVGASAAAQAVLAPFPGAQFQLPSNIDAVSGGSSMQLMVGYSGLVWSGNSSPNVTFTSGVHSLTLGRIGGGAYAAHNLPEPVLLTFEVIRPGRRRQQLQDASSTPRESIETMCLYWNIDTADWDDEGCQLVRANDTHVICACNHLTDFATAFRETAQSADFSAFTRLDLFTVENVLKNPRPFLLLFALYFLAAVGCLMGSFMDSKRKAVLSGHATSMLQLNSYIQSRGPIPFGAEVCMSVFLVANALFALLTLAVGTMGLVTLHSTLNWVFGNVGNSAILACAFFQLLMLLIGLRLTGIIPGVGSNRAFFVVWLVFGAVFLWMNVYLLQIGHSGTVLVPRALCPAADDGADEEVAAFCRRSWFSFTKTFWKIASLTNRRKIYEAHFESTNCTSSEFSGTYDVTYASCVCVCCV